MHLNKFEVRKRPIIAGFCLLIYVVHSAGLLYKRYRQHIEGLCYFIIFTIVVLF